MAQVKGDISKAQAAQSVLLKSWLFLSYYGRHADVALTLLRPRTLQADGRLQTHWFIGVYAWFLGGSTTLLDLVLTAVKEGTWGVQRYGRSTGMVL